MLLSREIAEVATDLKSESLSRPYVKMLMPEIVEDDGFWRTLIEIFEIVLHRRGYVVVRRDVLDFQAEMPRPDPGGVPSPPQPAPGEPGLPENPIIDPPGRPQPAG